MAFDINRLGPLYPALGFETPPALVQARLAAAAAAISSTSKEEAPAVIRLALGLPVSKDELPTFLSAFSEDPTFSASPGSPELRLLACGVIEGWLESGVTNAAILSASGLFGGLRSPKEDPQFREIVEARLRDLQSDDSPTIELLGKPGAFATAKGAEQANAKAAEGEFGPMGSQLAALVTGLATHSASQDDKLRIQLNTISRKVMSLSEQMEMQWWVANGYSLKTSTAFSKLGAVEATVRAAMELADLTVRPTGVRAAPALLDQILTPVKGIKTALTLAQIAEGTPIEWRRAWTANLPAGSNGLLCPVTYAIRLATQADDEADWRGRFMRESGGVKTDEKLPPLDWAIQLYREFLAIKATV